MEVIAFVEDLTLLFGRLHVDDMHAYIEVLVADMVRSGGGRGGGMRPGRHCAGCGIWSGENI